MRSLLLALGLVTWALAPPGLSGQVRAVQLREVVNEREEEYDAAKAQYDTAWAEEQRIRDEWNQLMDQHAAAFARDDDDEVQRLRGELQERTPAKRIAENAVQASQEQWRTAGENLMRALNAYLDILDGQLQRTEAGPDDPTSIEYVEYEERLRELEEELARVARETPELVMPEVEIRPGDGPRDIARKRNLVENRVTEAEGLLDNLIREIEGLTKRQAREQRRRDREARGARFDDNANPTGGARTSVTDDAGVTDSAGVTLPVKTLEERIAEKEELRQQVADYLIELKAKAEEIRRKTGGR